MSPCNSTLLTFYLTPTHPEPMASAKSTAEFEALHARITNEISSMSADGFRSYESQQIKISSLTSFLNKAEELQRKFRTVEKAKLEANVSDLTHSLVKTKASLREKDCLHEEIESRSKDQIRHWQELFIKAEEERRMLVTKIEELRERELQMIRILDHSIANFTDAQEVVSQATSSAPSSVIGDPNQGHNRADIVDLPNPPTQFLPGRQSMIPDNLAAPLPTIVKNSEPAMQANAPIG
ncbi:hypothetical protein D9757_010343 [Collybiopsis confluens]|uniref:Uncharacterized protein n=1 Tax=Collybiopsis confluens TaxID=2823264 RepID=A0A8H5LRX1_9AGAR|nr:hypothetical protein D9757_010343 [Collybiopsis confluens]